MPMVTEIALLQIKENQSASFEAAFEKAGSFMVFVEGHGIRIKLAAGRVKVEHDDAVAAAHALGWPLRAVLSAAEALGWAAQVS